MYDAGKIIGGLVVFIGLATSPFWYSAVSGQSGERPELERPAGETRCVEPLKTMTESHMDLLDDWRDTLVREGVRTYTATDGTQYEISLTATCLGCHKDRSKFCDQCHNYVGVSPYCWDCHVDPEGK